MTPHAFPQEQIQRQLAAAATGLQSHGIPVPRLDGKLLRPLVAYAMVPPPLRVGLGERFWSGALALQMVHEASLLHDDILDGAVERRGMETLAATAGISVALVTGDHYLTAAYRAAGRAGSPSFLERFIVAVERTVAGEIRQGTSAGRRVSAEEYRDLIEGKSGELFGAAAALGGFLFDLPDPAARVRLGRDLGALYQQVDDLLDYCPAAGTGKPPLQDYRQQKWTWMMDLAGLQGFGDPEDHVLELMHRPGHDGMSAAEHAVAALTEASADLVRRVQALSPGDTLVEKVLSGWVRAAEQAVAGQALTFVAAV